MTPRKASPLPEELREDVRVTSIAFVMLALIGYVLSLVRPSMTSGLLSLFADSLAESELPEVEAIPLMLLLVVNNLTAAGTSMLSGLVPVLRLPAFSLGLNAVLIGAFAAYYQTSGFGLFPFLAGTLPHGITELLGLSIACAAGLYLCRAVTERLFGRSTAQPVRDALRVCARAYARCVVPLLLISAAVEAFVSPAILRLFLR